MDVEIYGEMEPTSHQNILPLIEKATESGLHQEMIECFSVLKNTENKCAQMCLDHGLLLSCRYGRKFLAQLLLAHGANIETRDDDSNTPLLICAEKGFTDIALLLVDKGADTNSYNKDGDTALLLSIKTSGCSQLVERLLDKSDLNIHHVNNNGYTALTKAAEVLDLNLMTLILEKKNSKNHVRFPGALNERNIDLCFPSSTRKIAESVGLREMLKVVLNQTDKRKSLLRHAVLRKETYLIKLLLDFGIFDFGPNSPGNDRIVIPEFVISIVESKTAITNEDLDIVQILLRAGAPLYSEYTNSIHPLIMAIQIGSYNLIEIICSQEDGVIQKVCENNYYLNPLVLAAEKGRSDLVTLLIKHGANVNDTCQCSALSMAIKKGHFDCARILIDNEAKIDFEELFLDAVWSNNPQCFLGVLDLFGSNFKSEIKTNGPELLALAADRGNTTAIERLIKAGVDINATYVGKTPLMAATDLTCIELLIKLGADVNKIVKKEGKMYNFLIFSINESDDIFRRFNLVDLVKVLVRYEANLNAVDEKGDSALMKVSNNFDMQDVVQALIQGGAKVNKQNKKGESALHFAARCGSLPTAMILLENKSNINLQTHTGHTPLLYAVFNRSKDVIKYLVENKAKVNIKDNKKDTSLIKACCFNYDIETVKILIGAGASVNHPNKKGYTALMYAAKRQNHDLIKVLVESGADVNAINPRIEENALSILLMRNYFQRYETNSVDFLIENGADATCLHPSVIHQLVISEEVNSLRKIIILGLGPEDVDPRWFAMDCFISDTASPLMVSLLCGYINLAQFFDDIWFLTPSDVSTLAYNKDLRELLAANRFSECLEFLDEYRSQPMSLQKLSFVVVSSALGPEPGREDRVEELKTPSKINDSLLFKKAKFVEIDDFKYDNDSLSNFNSLDDSLDDSQDDGVTRHKLLQDFYLREFLMYKHWPN